MQMTRRLQVVLGAALLTLAGSSVSAQEGDPAAGAKVFNKCRACHDASPQEAPQ
jgi:cytochrome c